MAIRACVVGAALFCVLALGGALSGCAGGGEMSAKQKEGVEQRRYCERNPQDTAGCTGYLGFL